jgi:hypothetical protein
MRDSLKDASAYAEAKADMGMKDEWGQGKDAGA